MVPIIKNPTLFNIPFLDNKTLKHFSILKFPKFFIFLKLSNNLFLLIFISAKDLEDPLVSHEHLAFFEV